MEPCNLKPDKWLTVAAISETIEFRQITSAAMAKWVEVYLQGFLDTGRFNATAATRAAYVCATPESYRTLGCQVRSAKKVQAVIALFLKAVQRDILFDLAEIQGAIDAAEPGSVAQHRLISLKARMKRGIQDEAETPEPAPAKPKPQTVAPASTEPAVPKRFKIGDRITKRDDAGVLHFGIVTAVDADGGVLDANEVTT